MASGQGATERCIICLEDHACPRPSPWLRPCCSASVCRSCFQTYVNTAVEERKTEIPCPNDSCKNFLSLASYPWLLEPKNRATYYRINFAIGAGNGNTCPKCEHVATRLIGKDQRLIECENCQFKWCFQCQSGEQQGCLCKTDFEEADEKFVLWTTGFDATQDHHRNATKCPGCNAYIQRASGCPNMTCNQCSTNFCYDCGRKPEECECLRQCHDIDRRTVGADTPVGYIETGCCRNAPLYGDPRTFKSRVVRLATLLIGTLIAMVYSLLCLFSMFSHAVSFKSSFYIAYCIFVVVGIIYRLSFCVIFFGHVSERFHFSLIMIVLHSFTSSLPLTAMQLYNSFKCPGDLWIHISLISFIMALEICACATSIVVELRYFRIYGEILELRRRFDPGNLQHRTYVAQFLCAAVVICLGILTLSVLVPQHMSAKNKASTSIVAIQDTNLPLGPLDRYPLVLKPGEHLEDFLILHPLSKLTESNRTQRIRQWIPGFKIDNILHANFDCHKLASIWRPANCNETVHIVFEERNEKIVYKVCNERFSDTFENGWQLRLLSLREPGAGSNVTLVSTPTWTGRCAVLEYDRQIKTC